MNKSEFQERVRSFYQNHGRQLPWRETNDNYKIFVSEIMLQQTQVKRVIPKYKEWLENFPDFSSLAQANKRDVLQCWQGLGYNRRGNYLHQSAKRIVQNHEGKLPEDGGKLKELPGVGNYTAGALQAFCFEMPVVFVETNIRTVYIHHFFADKDNIDDTAIKDKIADTLPENRIREWYWGLMDYGAHLKKEVGNVNDKSSQHQTQSAFAGSNRQLRSRLLSFVLENGSTHQNTLEAKFSAETDRQKSVKTNLSNLVDEGLLETDNQSTYRPPA